MLTCKICGGTLMIQGAGKNAVCKNCGVEYSVEWLKEVLAEKESDSCTNQTVQNVPLETTTESTERQTTKRQRKVTGKKRKVYTEKDSPDAKVDISETMPVVVMEQKEISDPLQERAEEETNEFSMTVSEVWKLPMNQIVVSGIVEGNIVYRDEDVMIYRPDGQCRQAKISNMKTLDSEKLIDSADPGMKIVLLLKLDDADKTKIKTKDYENSLLKKLNDNAEKESTDLEMRTSEAVLATGIEQEEILDALWEQVGDKTREFSMTISGVTKCRDNQIMATGIVEESTVYVNEKVMIYRTDGQCRPAQIVNLTTWELLLELDEEPDIDYAEPGMEIVVILELDEMKNAKLKAKEYEGSLLKRLNENEQEKD